MPTPVSTVSSERLVVMGLPGKSQIFQGREVIHHPIDAMGFKIYKKARGFSAFR